MLNVVSVTELCFCQQVQPSVFLKRQVNIYNLWFY